MLLSFSPPRARSHLTSTGLLARALGVAAMFTVAGVPVPAIATEQADKPVHAIAMVGDPKHGPDFTHFSYVNPGAPKGGRLTLGAFGSFDSLNPLIIKGRAAAGIRGYVYESLLVRAYDEPFTMYGHLAKHIAVPDDRGSITFYMDPDARFSDGEPVTVDDVIFSHALLRDKGRHNHRSYYSKVSKVERIGDTGVRFTLDADGDREMPLILGLMPILPKHRIDLETFEETTFDKPIGSGPYLIADADPGVSITYKRNPNYWAANKPALRGRYNFDELRFDYYRDQNALFEAFKKGDIDVRSESDPIRWNQGFSGAALESGRMKRTEFPIATPSGMAALAFNTRRPPLNDPQVRRALIQLFDFNWINQSLYSGAYTRTESFFDRSELSSAGRPADETERTYLAPFADAVLPEVIDGSARLPETDGTGRNRANQRIAMGMLAKAGWRRSDGRLVNASGEPLKFEALAVTRDQERLMLTFARSVRPLGIEIDVRNVDSTIFQRRVGTFDFDMIQTRWGASLSPGNEQTYRWGSSSADRSPTLNYAGVRNPAADALIQRILEARDRPSFISAVRAFDRVLRSGNYVLPLFHLEKQWVAYWSHLAYPETTSLYGFQLDTWWQAKPKGE